MYFSANIFLKKQPYQFKIMPFIEEQDLTLMHEDLDKYKLKKEKAEDELKESQGLLISFQKKYRVTSILLGLLLGASLAACYYFYTNNSAGEASITDASIAAIIKRENIRVLDSIERADKRALRSVNEITTTASGLSSENLDETIDKVKGNTKGEKIYSVQVGVFYNKKKFPLLSSKTIPAVVTNKDEYFKYSLGLFMTLNEAKKFKKELIKLGFKDAFVASYINGKRLKIHD